MTVDPTSRARAVLILLAALQTIAATACGRRFDPDTTLTLAIDSGPASLDPRLGSDEGSKRVFELVFSGLFRMDDAARPVADLAASYTTSDPLAVVVTLRQGVLFQDGSPCAARDVVYTYRSILRDEVPSFRRGDLEIIDSVEAAGDRTVVFRLRRPFAPILSELNIPILKAGAGPDAARRPIGTGPFRLLRYRKDEDLVLERFEGYFQGPSGVRTIHLKIIPSETGRLLELLKGNVDLIVNDLSPDQFARVRRTAGFAVESRPGRNTVYAGFNMQDPILSDRRVRRAIALALDRPGIVANVLHGAATIARGLLPPGHWAYAPGLPGYEFDPEEAAAILDRAGYGDPDGSGPQPRFLLTCKTSTGELAQALATIIQAQLGRIGIGLEIRAYEWPTFYEDLKAGRFQIALSNWTEIGDPDVFRLRFHSRYVPPRGFNRGRYDNPEIDRLIEAGAAELGVAARALIYADVQRILARDLPYICLWHRDVTAARRDRVRGFRLTSGADFYPLRDITLVPGGRTAEGAHRISTEPPAQDRLDGRNRDRPGAHQTGRVAREVDHRRGGPAARRTAVQDEGHLLAEGGRNVRGRRRGCLSRAIGARGDDGPGRPTGEPRGDRMGGDAQPDRVSAAEEERREVAGRREHQGERPGPEGLGQLPRDLRELPYALAQRGFVGGDERQRHALRASFGLKDPLHGLGIARIGAQTVEGLRRVGDELPGMQERRRPAQESRIRMLRIDPLQPPHGPRSFPGW